VGHEGRPDGRRLGREDIQYRSVRGAGPRASNDGQAKAGGGFARFAGEPLETVAREVGVTVADLSGWRDRFLDGGAASLKSRPRDDRDDRIAQLQAKLGEITMEFARQEIGPGDRF